MTQAEKLARELAEQGADYVPFGLRDKVQDIEPETGVVTMEDGSELEPSKNVGGGKPYVVSWAKLSPTGSAWRIEDPDAGLVWRVYPEGMDDSRSRLMEEGES